MKNNFYFLLAALFILLAAEPFLSTERGGALLQLAFTLVLVIGAFSLRQQRWTFALGLGLAAVGTLAATGYLVTQVVALRVIDLLAILGFCILAAVSSLRQVLMTPGGVTLNTVMGALCIYLLLGIIWAIFYTFVEFFAPGAFKYPDSNEKDLLEDFLYYSFVTLTTLGFGDITPVHPVARTLSYLEAVIGQLYVAVLVAGLVAQHISSRGASTES